MRVEWEYRVFPGSMVRRIQNDLVDPTEMNNSNDAAKYNRWTHCEQIKCKLKT